jgi:lipopolysaccharide transport system permease protein
VVPWFAFLNVINPTVQMVEGNVSLITKVFFPRLLIAGSYALGASVDFAVAFFFLIVPFAYAYGVLTPQLFVLTPILHVLLLMIAMGIGLTLAPLNARYRDVKHMVPLALQLFYYSTPAIYPVSAVPPWASPWYAVNPLSLVITAYRGALQGRWPSMDSMVVLTIEAVLILAFGCWYYLRFDRRVVDVI